ncbi:MAG: hypothetical protein SWK90_07530 [Chloroflexota bacterium]|nr:hypothetical protein [Chloroflexota bacterium]
MTDADSLFVIRNSHEYRFVLIFSVIALVIASIPYVVGAALATEQRLFGGFVYGVEDCYSYLAKMRQGAEGAWLFHIAYTPEPHSGTFFFPFHLLLGKVAALLPGGGLTARMVWVYHSARVIFGLGLLLTVYRFLAFFTVRVAVRRLAWLMVTFGGGLGWLLVALGQSNWLGSMPLDFILPEGFTFLVLYALPHIALARTLLLWGILFLLRAWERGPTPDVPSPGRATCNTQHVSRFTFHAAMAGACWLVMGLIVPFYVAVAWAVTGVAWVALGLRQRRVMWREALVATVAALISAPVVAYSAWVFTTDPVYVTWAAQNRILSPHPLHYLAAYGVLLTLAAFAVRDAWHDKGPTWLALAWVAVVPFLVYLPFNLQRRLVEGVQIPLSLLAALGVSSFRLQGFRLRVVVSILVIGLSLTNVMLVAGNCLALRGQPAPAYRDAGEVAALDWLNGRVESGDVVLATYETGNYLPARTWAHAFVGHGPESVRAAEKKALVARFFSATTDEAWRRQLLMQYGVDYVFWGPAERTLGGFDPGRAVYLRMVYEEEGYLIFEVVDE